MANPFGLPTVILAEREARRRQQFQLGVYALLIATAVLLVGMLIQGCRSQRPSSANTGTEKPVGMANNITTNQTALTTNVPPVPEQTMEANCVRPGSASLPENITLPEPAATSTAPAVTPRSRPPVSRLRQAPPAHNARGVYVVKSGDTLVRIARAHGTTVQALKTANHLAGDHLFVGEKLRIPRTDLAAGRVAQN